MASRSTRAPRPSRVRPLRDGAVRPGGVGIHMVRQLVDEIAYHRADNRNHVVVTKRCDAPDSRIRTE